MGVCLYACERLCRTLCNLIFHLTATQLEMSPVCSVLCSTAAPVRCIEIVYAQCGLRASAMPRAVRVGGYGFHVWCGIHCFGSLNRSFSIGR